ncbi:thioredoxin family protein [Candidatus Woesearchaeota archaeon]|nr:thioredoxin family protein [Candidatus Woesearchaeota archaeon]
MRIKDLRFITAVLILVAITAGCTSDDPSADNDNRTAPAEPLILTEDQELDPTTCQAHGLEGKNVMLESQSCGHCRQAKPILQSIAYDKNVTIDFVDVSTEKGQSYLEDHDIMIRYTPTVIMDCHVLIGSQQRETYERHIGE